MSAVDDFLNEDANALKDLGVIVSELSALFVSAEFDGEDRITLVSMVGSKFHRRVQRAVAVLEKIGVVN